MQIDARLLKVKMTERGFDQYKDLAEKAGITRVTLTNVMRGHNLPSMYVANAICQALELSPTESFNIFFAPNLRHAKV
ncbi:helix-turn-helix domain-containing protein [Jeotgalibaca sp. A127]|uniref:helix-turn-helix domain-containing protein n=1 Tax=Jeotgalibaca sp. A127 TaxID=3457324 RepID=UPI003FD51896